MTLSPSPTPLAPHAPIASLTPLDPLDPLDGTGRAETLRCSSTADFLAALPLLTGFTDENSLFIVLFRGRRGGSVLRLNLPDPASPHQADHLVDGIVALLHESGAGAEGPAVVITTSLRFGAQGDPPWARLAHRVRRRLRREGWPLRELAVVAGDGWCTLLGESSGRQRPLSEITRSELGLAVRGRMPRALDTIGALPETDQTRAAAVAGHVQELRLRAQARSAHPAAQMRRERSRLWIRQVTAVASACFGESDAAPALAPVPDPAGAVPTSPAAPHDRSGGDTRTPPRLLARLIDAAQQPPSWLALALTALTRAEFVVSVSNECGGERFERVSVAAPAQAEDEMPNSWSIEQLLLSISNEMPDQRKLRAAITALEDAVAHAPHELRPAPLALLAWAWWMLGMQSVAIRLVEQAIRIEADHELSLMVRRLCDDPPAAQLRRLRSEFADAA